MPLPRYQPPIRRVQDEYSSEVARRFRARRRGPLKPGPKIPDNSEPWNADPRTVGDLWEIAEQVQAVVDQWGPKK